MREAHKLNSINAESRVAVCWTCDGMVVIRKKGKDRHGNPRWACRATMLDQERERRKGAKYKKYQKSYQRKYEPGRDPEMRHRNTRDAQLRKYGLTQRVFDEMVEIRGGQCDLCMDVPVPAKGKRYALYVDHDHVTGRVRGLLCLWCNLALGHLRERPEVAERVGTYLGDNL